MHKGLIGINPHGLFLYKNKIIALFFNFSKNDNTILSELFKKIWNLGGSPAIFIVSEDMVNIYNGFSFDTNNSFFDKLKIGNNELLLENIENNFSIWDVVTGKSFENLKPHKAQVDEKLLENLENTKKILSDGGLDDAHAQNLIGRLLFSRYLLDKGIKVKSKYFQNKHSFLKLITNKELLYEYFDYLKKTFNGDLFPVTPEEVEQVTDVHLLYLLELFSGSDINRWGIQRSLFDIYDFNIIPIELISEVYERFLGKKKQKKNAAYYTPSFLVDYILEKTVKIHLTEKKTCKIFDPSCGSGIFLVESLRAIIENNLAQNGSIEKEKLKKLLTDNIFGVDIDETAVNLTVFSLCLTLLDYINPKDITTFKFPALINSNLFIADFFDTDHSFNNKLKKLDFILGNPPWGSDKEDDNNHIKYFQNNNIPVSDKQIAQTFIARTKDFSHKNTKCALVLPSKPVLYNHNAQEYRRYFLNNFYIKEVLELSPVRSQLFARAVAPTAIIFFNYAHANTTVNNNLVHTSIKPNVFLKYLKLIVIEKNDIKQIKQQYFILYDYLWKIMLYGNVLDFYLIKRLKEEYDSLNQVIEKNNLDLPRQGFQLGGGDQNDGTHLLGKPYLDTKKKALKRFFINETSCENWEIDTLHRPRTKEVFQPPYVLLKKGFSKQDFSLVSTYTENEFVFTDSITAIRGNSKTKDLLKSITGCLNSSLFSYHFLLQGSSAGVEREQGHNKEDRFELPICINKKIVQQVDKIQTLHIKLNSELMKNLNIEEKVTFEEESLNEIILESFGLSIIEKSLIDYSINVTIPQINNHNKPIAKTTEKQLKEYAQIFANHFGKRWNGNPEFFEVDIYYNDHIVGINFKVVNSKPKQKIKLFQNKNTDKLLSLIKIGEEKISDRFFKQRDIRGFNKSSFYVIKSNQYKNWHPAVAYGDLSEFVEAMLQAEKQNGEN